jgi:hypothetical protein
VRSGARGGGAGLGEGDLLVLAEEGDFALSEAQLGVGDRGGHRAILTTWSDQRHDARQSAPCCAVSLAALGLTMAP